MTAFVSFVRAYAIWIYLLCAFGVLIGVKMLTDARRLARTTLFSLEQERAGEQSYRAIILIGVLLAAAVVATIVNVVGGAIVPAPESPILRGATPTLSAIVFPTNTASSTFTRTPPPATETPFLTSTPVITATATRAIKPTAAPATPTPPLPPVILTAPPNGNVFTGSNQANAAMTFKWNWSCDQCKLASDDRFVITINYIDTNGKLVAIGGGTQNNFFVLAYIIRGYGQDVWHQAKEDKFDWSVQVKRGDQPLTPPSDIWKFVWH